MSVRARLELVFGIDPRALAALRIGLAAVILADLALRLGDFATFYTDVGVLPGEILPERARAVLVPLHTWSGAPAYQALLFGAAAGAALLMAVGRFTRSAVVASWVLMLSLHGRSAMVGDYGDEILRQLMFWCMFLPLGRCWSLDARRAPGTSREPVFSVASAGLLLQIACIYFFTALLKDGPDWRRDGTAIEIVLQRDWALRPFGAFLLEHMRGSLRFGTFAVLAFEFLAPLLLFWPFATRSLRIGLVYLAWFFQIGLGLSLVLGLMPFVNSAMMVVFLPRSWWDAAVDLLSGRGRTSGPEPPGPPAPAPNPWVQALAACFLVLMLAINVASLREGWRLPDPALRVAQALGVQQRWAMFSPNAPRDDGWYIIPGVLRSGHWVDLWAPGAELTWQKPERVADVHRSYRWCVYENRLREPAFDTEPNLRFRRRYAEWLCERWNAAHGESEELLKLGLFWVMEPTVNDDRPPLRVPHQIFEYECAAAGEALDRSS